MCRRMKRLDYDISHVGPALVMLDLVLLFVEVAMAEEVVNGFIVLWMDTVRCSR